MIVIQAQLHLIAQNKNVDTPYKRHFCKAATSLAISEGKKELTFIALQITLYCVNVMKQAPITDGPLSVSESFKFNDAVGNGSCRSRE